MRIGIMTPWWCPENYGQLLQGFALQEYLRRQGHMPFLVKYTAHVGARTRLMRVVARPSRLIASLRARAAPGRAARSARGGRRSFEAFRRQHVTATRKVYRAASDLRDSELDADAYIVGSDQVWSLLALDREARPWFLDFGRDGAKRIAYSASFGSAVASADFIGFIRPLLARFDGIGVREASGVEICRLAGRGDAVHVLDPTLLLSRDDYRQIASECSAPDQSGGHAFLYFLKANVSVPWKEVKDYCSAHNLDPHFVAVYDTKGFPFARFSDPTPAAWLDCISHADAVFTNSFHGTVFSILMQRPFIVFLREGGGAQMNDRIGSLLTTLGLQSRIHRGEDGCISGQMDAAIDWSLVNKKMALARERSTDFLRRCGV